jgi:TPR repeat protein
VAEALALPGGDAGEALRWHARSAQQGHVPSLVAVGDAHYYGWGTARDAAELMRPVMAIPGPISAPTSEGCHRLIGERSAELVTSVADAIELISTL